MEQPWRQDFCHTWWWYRAGWRTKPKHNLQDWLFQRYRVCKLLRGLTFVLCCLTPDFAQIARGLMFLSALNISSDSPLCSEEGKHTERQRWLGRGIATEEVQPGVGLFFPLLFGQLQRRIDESRTWQPFRANVPDCIFLSQIKHAGSVSARGSGSWLLALAEFGNRWKPGAVACQSKLAFVPQHASLV